MLPRFLPRVLLWIGVATLAGAPALHAQPLVNGDFEAPVLNSGDFSYNPSIGDATWNFFGSSGISASDGPWAPTDGATSQMAFLQINGNEVNGFSQSFSFASSGVFTLGYIAGTRDGYPGIDYTVSLTRDSDSTIVFTTNDTTVSPQPFRNLNYSVSVPTTGNYTLQFLALTHGDTYTDRSAVFDNIAVTAIPEPSTYTVITGLVALGLVARRRR